MSVKRYEIIESSSVFEDADGVLVDYSDYAALEATCAALAAENAGLKQGHCGTALLEREEMHAKTVGRLMGELEAKDKWIAELEAKLEIEPKVPEATFDSPDIPAVEPNWNDPTLREPGIWAYGFLEGQKAMLSNAQPEPATDDVAAAGKGVI